MPYIVFNRYKLLIDFPDVPAGEILEFDGRAYRGTTHRNLWFDADVVVARSEWFEVIDGT